VGIQGALAEDQAKKPANLVFLVDVSGSMSDADKLPLVKVLLRRTLNVLAPTDTLSLVTYASSTGVVLPPTRVENRVEIEEAISRLEAGGSTNGEGGLQLAYEQAQKSMIEGGINHVLLCTDGDFNVGISDPKALADFISKKRDSGVTLTAIGFGQSRSGDEQMEQLSNHGDGIYAVVYDEDQATKYANERLLATLVRIAKDMKIQVEFNPTQVRAYRLIGYENRDILDEDFRDDLVDAGDIGAGHRVTALYEIVRAGKEVPMPKGAPPLKDGDPKAGEREIGANDLVKVKVRYKRPGALSTDPAREVVATLAPGDVLDSADAAGDDFRWAAAMATLAEVLRVSPFASTQELRMLESLTSALGAKDADHAELVRLLPLVELGEPPPARRHRLPPRGEPRRACPVRLQVPEAHGRGASRARSKGQGPRPKALGELASIVTPDTILEWYRKLVAAKYDGTGKRGCGRPRRAVDVRALVVRMACENPRWGYTRMVGAMRNLGHELGRNTVKRILADAGIAPAPEPNGARGCRGRPFCGLTGTRSRAQTSSPSKC
jgi:secreted protein with Ig-like and vWFA domain